MKMAARASFKVAMVRLPISQRSTSERKQAIERLRCLKIASVCNWLPEPVVRLEP